MHAFIHATKNYVLSVLVLAAIYSHFARAYIKFYDLLLDDFYWSQVQVEL